MTAPRAWPKSIVMITGFFQGAEMPDAGWWEALWPDPARVLTDCGLTAGAAAVDLCAGTGWFTLPMARIARHVTAIDIDGALLNVARRRLADAGLTNCDFAEADAYDLARVVPAPVDFVFLANAFHGVPDRPRLAAAVAKILKPGGQFAIVNWHQRPRERTTVLGEPRGPATALRMSADATIAAVEPSGLRLVRVVEVPPHHYSAIFARTGARAG
jgi:ubiquinone/menaquinone biosynthesis C-methylase UbiE